MSKRIKFRHILVEGGIGDALFLTPAIREMKSLNRNTRIFLYLTRKSHRAVFANNPHVTAMFSCSGRLRSLLRAFGLDLEWTGYAAFRPNEIYRVHASIIIGEMLSVKVQDARPELFLTHAEQIRSRALTAGLRRPVVGFHISSAGTQNKEWFPERWRQLILTNPDITFVQLGLESDTAIEGAVQLRGLHLRASFSVLASIDGFIGLDSGLAHISKALGLPGVTLYGASSPSLTHLDGQVSLRSNVECSPCIDTLGRGACPFRRKCMAGLEVKVVSSELRRVLGLDQKGAKDHVGK